MKQTLIVDADEVFELVKQKIQEQNPHLKIEKIEAILDGYGEQWFEGVRVHIPTD